MYINATGGLTSTAWRLISGCGMLNVVDDLRRQEVHSPGARLGRWNQDPRCPDGASLDPTFEVPSSASHLFLKVTATRELPVAVCTSALIIVSSPSPFYIIHLFACFPCRLSMSRLSIETSEMRRTELIPPSIAQLAVLHPVHNVVLDSHLPFAITATHLCGQAPTPVNWSLLVTSSSSNSGLTQSAASQQPLCSL